MSSESVWQVALNWVDVGSFNTRLVVRFYDFYSVSPEYFGYTPVPFEETCNLQSHSQKFNHLTPNDLKRRRAVSPLEIKVPSKNICEKPRNTLINHSVY
jgi:hypothetical protein